jgi:hypothetical protein
MNSSGWLKPEDAEKHGNHASELALPGLLTGFALGADSAAAVSGASIVTATPNDRYRSSSRYSLLGRSDHIPSSNNRMAVSPPANVITKASNASRDAEDGNQTARESPETVP